MSGYFEANTQAARNCQTLGCEYGAEPGLACCLRHRCEAPGPQRGRSATCNLPREDDSTDFCSKHRCTFEYPNDVVSQNAGQQCGQIKMKYNDGDTDDYCEIHVNPCMRCYDQQTFDVKDYCEECMEEIDIDEEEDEDDVQYVGMEVESSDDEEGK